jgi:hypothetical protein
MSTSNLNAGSGVQWPNVVGVGSLPNPTIQRWFNTSAFIAPPIYQYGNEGRNTLYGPGTKQIDLSLFKSFRFSPREGTRLQLRAEAFNILNTPQFNNPNASIGSATQGMITSAGNPPLFQRTSRQIQVAVKLYW